MLTGCWFVLSCYTYVGKHTKMNVNNYRTYLFTDLNATNKTSFSLTIMSNKVPYCFNTGLNTGPGFIPGPGTFFQSRSRLNKRSRSILELNRN